MKEFNNQYVIAKDTATSQSTTFADYSAHLSDFGNSMKSRSVRQMHQKGGEKT
ncbi:MAG: hypothetical protein PVG65_00325 [Candidatus Thorarchaeota archaeon]|jgi:hypothetical protein